MNIRYAEKEEIGAVSGLWLQMVKEAAPDYAPNVEWWVKMAEGLFDTGNYRIAVAESDTGIIGFLDWMLYPEPSTGKIHAVGQHFFVLHEHRDKDIAGRLYKRVVRDMKRYTQAIDLFCFETERRFWQKKGYRPKRFLMRRSHV